MRRIFISLMLLIMTSQYSFSQMKDEHIKSALLIVDIQEFYFPGEGPGLVNAEHASEKAKEILQIFRDNERLVVHVRHKASKGFEIHKNVLPLPNEKVITKQEVNSFKGTDLLEFLQSNDINRLVIIGMQTHMCLEAAVRAGYDFGFECIVIEDACATRDLTFEGKTVKAEDVHASTLATIQVGGYAKVVNTDSFKEEAEKYLYRNLK